MNRKNGLPWHRAWSFWNEKTTNERHPGWRAAPVRDLLSPPQMQEIPGSALRRPQDDKLRIWMNQFVITRFRAISDA